MTLSQKKYFTYFLDLFDTSISEFDGITKKHPSIKRISSGIHEYFPLFRNNFLFRENWFEMDHSQALAYPEIDFCITNSAKIQTKSKIHFRILLDTQEHFISNKSAFYEMFQKEEFILPYEKFIFNENSLLKFEIFADDDYVILKPDKSCMGVGIQILKYSDIAKIKNITNYTTWTISKFITPKLYDGKVISNRLYFLIVKSKNTVKGYLYDEFVNYIAMEELSHSEEDFSPENFQKRFITNFTPTNYTEEDFFNNRHISHDNYKNIFTEEEFSNAIMKIKSYLIKITEKISEHITCSNDWMMDGISFHIYGVDALIEENGDVKIIEINGAPSIIERVYPNSQCMNYSILINEMLKVILPKDMISLKIPFFGSASKFIFLTEKIIQPPEKKFYIAKSIALNYPFILEGFMNPRRKYFYKRIKNPFYRGIDMFYGLRDLYVNKFTSDKYYNELVDFNSSECSRNSRIINKIQGVTYYLANKERLYEKLKEKYPLSLDYHPKSISLILNFKFKSVVRNISLLEYFLKEVKNIIIKPSCGSQGKGITVSNSKNPYEIMNIMIKIKDKYDYDSFLISEYIDNPYLYKILDDTQGRKFNIRFYVLIFINHNEELKAFILNEQIVYFCISEYNSVKKNLISQEDQNIMKSLTNLQLISVMNEKYGIKLKIEDYISSLKELNLNSKSILKQFKRICYETLNATKSEFRCINRFVEDNACFNLLAYDTLLDQEENLHLIEVNRGPDLNAFYRVLKHEMSVNIFEEIFDICVDRKDSDYENFEELELG